MKKNKASPLTPIICFSKLGEYNTDVDTDRNVDIYHGLKRGTLVPPVIVINILIILFLINRIYSSEWSFVSSVTLRNLFNLSVIWLPRL